MDCALRALLSEEIKKGMETTISPSELTANLAAEWRKEPSRQMPKPTGVKQSFCFASSRQIQSSFSQGN
jgi:hypothetical protein